MGLIVNSVIFTLYGVVRKKVTACAMFSASRCDRFSKNFSVEWHMPAVKKMSGDKVGCKSQVGKIQSRRLKLLTILIHSFFLSHLLNEKKSLLNHRKRRMFSKTYEKWITLTYSINFILALWNIWFFQLKICFLVAPSAAVESRMIKTCLSLRRRVCSCSGVDFMVKTILWNYIWFFAPSCSRESKVALTVMTSLRWRWNKYDRWLYVGRYISKDRDDWSEELASNAFKHCVATMTLIVK